MAAGRQRARSTWTRSSTQHRFELTPVSAGNWTDDEPNPLPPIGRMRVVRTLAELAAVLERARNDRRTIGLVPTMGAFHDGHLSLIRLARARCETVVVSLFVNPAQFDEHADLERYPRDERRDVELAAAAGADVLFIPPVAEMYPPGFATAVEVIGLTDRLEGAARGAAHFRGVATVVTKLLCMTAPQVAFFGQKDAQQLAVIRRLVADLNLPVAIESAPTVREPDGLAASSRNVLLSSEERSRALALLAGLRAARQLAQIGVRSGAELLQGARESMVERGVEPEYLELVDPDSFEPRERLARATLLVVAARVGSVRLIDNIELQPAAVAAPSQTPREVLA